MVRWRNNYPGGYKASLDAEAEKTSSASRSRLSILSYPRPRSPSATSGRSGRSGRNTRVFQGALKDMNPLPQIAWDVRCVPSTLVDVDEEADEEARAAGP